ncbi:MAG: hypothetical protein U5K00_08225 [Melioribacteraceae bacterium]|nr:hypothetical protein [Melioribacteraceae bacterium]
MQHGKGAVTQELQLATIATLPQDHIVRTYYFKAMDGLRHATMFTFRLEPQVIRIKDAGKAAVQENCIRCHSNQIHPIALRAINNRSVEDQRSRLLLGLSQRSASAEELAVYLQHHMHKLPQYWNQLLRIG